MVNYLFAFALTISIAFMAQLNGDTFSVVESSTLLAAIWVVLILRSGDR